MKLNIPDYVKRVMDTLNNNGFEAFVVGGAVRDAMMGKIPDDWDVATDATAQQTKNCFAHHFDTGIKHGTITVMMGKKPVEVTTYRVDGEYRDNRRPETVNFTKDIKDDLKRRDFTINAMAYNDEKGVVDLYGGAEDLNNKIVRCVGYADTRFNEDALRILRAIRFSVKLGFEIEKCTLKSIRENCGLLKNISGERIQTELLKMLETSDDLRILFDSGVAEVIIPEVNFEDLRLNVSVQKEMKLSALLFNSKNPGEFFNRLKFDNKTKQNVLKIIECSHKNISDTEYEVRKILNRYGENLFEKSLAVMECYGKDVEYLREIYNRVKGSAYLKKHLAVTGNDVAKLGISGKDIGRVMNILLDEVMKDNSANSKEKLLEMLQCIVNCDKIV